MSANVEFEEFFKEFWRPVLALFQRRGLRPEDAKDLAQETFLQVHKSLPRYREEKRKAWVLTIAKRVLQNSFRSGRARKRSGETVSFDDLTGGDLNRVAEGGGTSNPQTDLVSKDRLDAVRGAIDALPPQMRRCIRLRIDGMTGREIAAGLQITEKAVNSHLFQARKRLQVALQTDLSTNGGSRG